MKLKLIAVLIAAALTIGLFVTAIQISPVRAVPTCWIVDSLTRPGWDFASLANAINSPSVVSGDQIHVRDSHVESLLAQLVINQNNLWIIGGPAPTPTIDVNGNTIAILGNNVFIWGLNIVDTGGSATALWIGGLGGSGGGCIIENNMITGMATPGSQGIVITRSPNNLIALNTVSGWDYGIIVTGITSTGNEIKLNTVTPTIALGAKGIWLNSALGAPSFNKIYWNNLMTISELWDDLGNPVNYFDDTFPGGPGWLKGNYLAITRPLGWPPVYPVPANGVNLDSWTVAFWFAPISQIKGDVNLDGAVNILDAIKSSNDFLKAWCQYRWDPRTDINGDGVINILDAIVLANGFNKHY
jgi:hypothetical protein